MDYKCSMLTQLDVLAGLDFGERGTSMRRRQYHRALYHASEFFYACYYACVNGTEFTDQEKATVASTAQLALPGLVYGVGDLQSEMSAGSVDSVRIQRSGIEFFLTTFTGPAIDELRQCEDLRDLDSCLRTSHDVIDVYTDSARGPRFEQEIAKLGSAHWWFKD